MQQVSEHNTFYPEQNTYVCPIKPKEKNSSTNSELQFLLKEYDRLKREISSVESRISQIRNK